MIKYATFQRFVNNPRNPRSQEQQPNMTQQRSKSEEIVLACQRRNFISPPRKLNEHQRLSLAGKKSVMIRLLVFLVLLAVDSRRKIRHTTDCVRGHFYASETTKRALGEQSGSTISKDVEMKRRQLGASRAAADYENSPGIRGIFCGYSECYVRGRKCRGMSLTGGIIDSSYVECAYDCAKWTHIMY